MTSRLSVKKIAGLLLAGFAVSLGLLWLLGQERQSTIAMPQAAPPSRAIAGFDSPWRFITPENNLTRRAAQGLAAELIDKNKGGPAETPEGLMVTLNPAKTLTAMLSSVKQVPHEPFQGVALSELRILQKDTSAHRRAYFEDLSAVLNRTINSVVNPTTTPEQFAAALTQDNTLLDRIIIQHDAAISSLGAMPVPASLAPLHKKAIDNFTKTNIVLQGVAAMEVDPMRAVLALNISPAIAAETDALRQEFQTAIQREYRSMTFWEQIFGSNTAQAIFPGMPVIDPANLARMILEWGAEVAIQFLQGELLSQLRGNVLEFVQGAQEEAVEHCPPGQTYIGPDGRTLCPRFVLNWEQTLFRAQRSADVRLLQEIAEANIPEAHRGALIQMHNQPAEEGYGVTFRTLTQGAQNCREVEDPVAAMLCWTDPANSFTLHMALAEQRREELRGKYQEGRQAQAIAGQGFKDTQKCVREMRNLETGEVVCIEYITTEPGVLTQELMARAKTSEFDEIINADDLRAVIANFATSLVNQLLDAGKEGLLGLIRQTYTTPPLIDPMALEFSVTPDTILEGESATLEWRADNAILCFLDGDAHNPLERSGTRIVNPVTTTIYQLECAHPLGRRTQSVTLTVLAVGITFSADPTEIYQGATTTLTWSTENAVFCTGSGAWEWRGTEEDPGTRGSEEVTPTETSTYELQCFNQAGRYLRESVTITVAPLPGEGEEQPLP